MANPFLIIDGYNVMHAAGIARRKYAAGDLERCRRRLEIRLAASLSPQAATRTTIVYDAFTSPGNDNRSSTSQGLRVLFAAQGHDADGEIERLLDQHSSPRQVIVVSSDHRLHKAARRRKAKCVDSDVFLHEIESELAAPIQKPAKPVSKSIAESADELQQWEKTFRHSEASGVNPDATGNQHSAFDSDYLKNLQQDLEDGTL